MTRRQVRWQRRRRQRQLIGGLLALGVLLALLVTLYFVLRDGAAVS